MLIKADVLLPDNTIIVYEKKDIGFGKRISDFKNGKKKGIILGVYLKREMGDPEVLKLLSQQNHENRKKNQPGPKCNLGTTYCSLGERTVYGKILKIFAVLYYRFCASESKATYYVKKRYELELRLAGGSSILPYLYQLDRFIWKDENADESFERYQNLIKKYLKSQF